MIKAVLFDLDDTLYRESDYVESGYRAVARHVSEAYGCSFTDVFRTMMSVHVSEGRKMVLPVIMNRFLKGAVSLFELVSVYRAHIPTIRLFPGYARLLRSLRETHHLGVITDGVPDVQRRKAAALGLERLVHRIVYSSDYGQEHEKPDPFGLILMMEHFGVESREAIFVGDSTVKDCKGARRAGMISVLVLPAGQEPRSPADNASVPDFVIESLHELPHLLKGGCQ